MRVKAALPGGQESSQQANDQSDAERFHAASLTPERDAFFNFLGRVEERRGGSGKIATRFPLSARRTRRANFAYPALRQVSPPDSRKFVLHLAG
jgi:hypothetical protein